MSPTIIGNIRMAIATLRATRMRSFLTMLGVIIGVVSVVTIVSIGQGVKNQISSEIDQLGRDLITVRPGVASSGSGVDAIKDIAKLGPGAVGSLSRGDTDIVRKTNGVATAVPLGLVGGQIAIDGKPPTREPVVLASSADMEKVLNKPIEFGEFFGDGSALAEQPAVAVIGHDLAQELYGEATPLGRSFDLMGQTFFVRGVLKKVDSSPLSLGTDFNNSIIIPYKTAQQMTNDNVPLYEILAKPDSADQVDQTIANITADLNQAHKEQQRFSVLRQDQSLATTNQILGLLTMLIAGVAAISLLVGGIGIMDVMLVSVAERTQEIGLRKALGASNRQIMLQFLTESAVLSFAGGIIGVIISLLINFGFRVTTSLTPAISWWAMLLSVFVALLVGVIFGTMPALKAARKDPIEALRNR